MMSPELNGESETIRMIRVFLASPGDTAEERELVEKTISELNREGRDSGYRVDLWIWEKDSYPSVGEDAQDVLNNQVYNYDIFVGILSQRFGTPTLRANSGTEEEFDRAYEKYLKSVGRLQILFYFMNPMVRLFDIDPYQVGLVSAFRKRLESMGIFYRTFDKALQFRLEFQNHLRAAIRAILHPVPVVTPIASTRSSEHLEPVKQSLPDWTPETQRIYPQWASYREVNLENSKNFDLTGNFSSESPYYRFGFKLMRNRGKIFGDGGIQSQDNNLVVHVGRNSRGEDFAFLTTYYNGVREELNRSLRTPCAAFSFHLSVQAELVRVSVDEEIVYEKYIPPELVSRLVLLAWGDENQYTARFQNIKLHLRP